MDILPGAEPLLENDFDIPDLFILDKQLSGDDGLDVCYFLKRQDTTRHIPVIMLSASPSILTTAMNYCADGALEKPFKMHDLRTLVAQLISTDNGMD